MANVEFMDARKRGDRLHIMISQAMTGIDCQPKASTVGYRFADTLKFNDARSFVGDISVGPCVNFDYRGTSSMRRIQLCKIGINEQ